MINKLTLSSFKAFFFETIEIKPITVLLGPNNSGKSSILSSFRLLTQTIESYDTKVPLLLNGVLGDFGTYKDIIFNNIIQRHMGLEIEFDNVYPESSYVKFKKFSISVKYRYRRNRREIILNNITIKTDGRPIIETSYSGDSEKHLVTTINNNIIPPSVRSSLSRMIRIQNFLPYIYYGLLDDKQYNSIYKSIGIQKLEFEKTSHLLSSINRYLHYGFRQVEYIGAMRLAPSRTYLFTGEKRVRIGASGEYATNILAMDTSIGGSKKYKIREKVIEWLHKAGIASDLKIVPISDRHFEIRIQHPITKEFQNYADVGYGHSQIIPVLVGGYNLESGSTYLIEQPEIHLHPKAQSELGDFLLDLYRNDVQSIVETHSEHLVIRLQQYIAQGLIPPDKILFYYVYAKNERKKIHPLRVDENGYFIDEWPEGFFTEKLEEARKLSRIRYLKGEEEHK